MKRTTLGYQKANLLSKIVTILGMTQVLDTFVSQPANALQCRASSDLATSCESGLYDLNASIDINVQFGNLLLQNQLLGTSKIFVGTPVDAIVGDIALGNVGTFGVLALGGAIRK
jgi:hypothetical protein